MTDVAADESRRPGRPRSEHCDRAILEAALAEYAECGFGAMSVEAVAARAGVSKATIYRRYPAKIDLVMAAVEEISRHRQPIVDSGSLRDDLRGSLANLRDILEHTVLGRTVRMVVADAALHDDLLQVHVDFVQRRRRSTVEAIRRAQARGDLRADVDPDLAADVLSGPLFYRHLVSHMAIDDAFLDGLVDSFLAAYRPGQVASSHAARATSETPGSDL